MKRRKLILFSLLGALLAGACWQSYSYLSGAQADAQAAWADAADCQSLADRIEAARGRPSVAHDHERVWEELIGLVEAAAKTAGIPAAGLVRFVPEPPRRIEDSPYKEKPVRVLLRDVTLGQLTAMAHGLATSRHRLHVTARRVAAPRRDDTGDLWTAELVLVYLIYEPAKPSL
ncbi:MAG: hypothetical protein NTV86_10270 [Planctomycetota bacterium]|nr:hypothetical protein [Planctomycetota bacterium]